jgi:hypothetical protein
MSDDEPPLPEPVVAGLSESERVTSYIEMWKQATQVNQHFNDIEWRIRGLALTAATFAIGAAGVAANDGETFAHVSVGSLLLVVALLLWYAFYFVDSAWYHPLLKASVDKTMELEEEIAKSLPLGGLARAITEGSPYTPNAFVRRLSGTKPGVAMRSPDKLKWFYRVGAAALIAVAISLQMYAIFRHTAPPAPTRVVVVHGSNP